ncbi:hypothetical protein N7474_001990 [Penicillium riverlandense]|uniref:uncharacterized protein n=1 Tax=Penicillium riverlandense TaxID=1903569 RepID=UPI0025481970|nr:uncharacterized protein N7474_001990 [Penicillium riverlandense]KAJ5833679.1 hypothetical protein N7474_001990 [Penicillium riverlandense]
MSLIIPIVTGKSSAIVVSRDGLDADGPTAVGPELGPVRDMAGDGDLGALVVEGCPLETRSDEVDTPRVGSRCSENTAGEPKPSELIELTPSIVELEAKGLGLL